MIIKNDGSKMRTVPSVVDSLSLAKAVYYLLVATCQFLFAMLLQINDSLSISDH